MRSLLHYHCRKIAPNDEYRASFNHYDKVNLIQCRYRKPMEFTIAKSMEIYGGLFVFTVNKVGNLVSVVCGVRPNFHDARRCDRNC